MRSHVGKILIAIAIMAASAVVGAPGHAGQASVLDATVVANPDGTYGFNVTVSHADEGWRHYANKWDVLGPDGTVIATRVLYHPHVDEQPFTRSLGRVEIPIGVTRVVLRASDSVHGDGTRTFALDLPPRK